MVETAHDVKANNETDFMGETPVVWNTKKSVSQTKGKMTAMERTGDILGFARVSTVNKDLSGQVVRLNEVGAIRVFEDVISGKQFERCGLSALIDHARAGDSLAIIRLDRLGRSQKQMLETVAG